MSDLDKLVYERALDAIAGALFPKHILDRGEAEQAAQDVMDDLSSSQLSIVGDWDLEEVETRTLPQLGEITPAQGSVRDGSTPIGAEAADAAGLES